MSTKKKKKKTASVAREQPAGLNDRLRRHFGTDPVALPVLQRTFETYQRANVHQAIEGLLEKADSCELIGVTSLHDYASVSLAKLTGPSAASSYEEGPVEYIDEPLPGNLRLACVKRGLYLIRSHNSALAVLIDKDMFGRELGPRLEIMGSDKETAGDFLQLLSQEIEHGKGLRGGIISLKSNHMCGLEVHFHHLPKINRENVILPEEVLRRVERHTLDFSAHAARLKAAGRHLKRGILLHGPPGTGKTFTSMYVATQLEGRTVFLLTASGIPLISQAVAMARALQPATLILEDVDLVGTERENQQIGANAILFELLNEMDGLADDADLLFILTTNRPEILEPALSSRPGRIDQAIEIPLPDKECRHRLIELYGRGLAIRSERMDEFLDRTEGASAAFIREFLRKAAVLAALEQDGEIIVGDTHLDAALVELLFSSGGLTRALLGAAPSAD